jgi:hypothetical protein
VWWTTPAATNTVTFGAGLATLLVAYFAYRLSSREARERRVRAVLEAKIAAAMCQPLVYQLWLYSARLRTALTGIRTSQGRTAVDSRASLDQLRHEIENPPAMLDPDQIAQLAPLGHRVHIDLALSIGAIRHTFGCIPVAESYLVRQEQDELAPHEWIFDGYCDGMWTAQEKLKALMTKFGFVAGNSDPDFWRDSTREPHLEPIIKGRLKRWLWKHEWWIRHGSVHWMRTHTWCNRRFGWLLVWRKYRPAPPWRRNK